MDQSISARDDQLDRPLQIIDHQMQQQHPPKIKKNTFILEEADGKNRSKEIDMNEPDGSNQSSMEKTTILHLVNEQTPTQLFQKIEIPAQYFDEYRPVPARKIRSNMLTLNETCFADSSSPPQSSHRAFRSNLTKSKKINSPGSSSTQSTDQELIQSIYQQAKSYFQSRIPLWNHGGATAQARVARLYRTCQWVVTDTDITVDLMGRVLERWKSFVEFSIIHDLEQKIQMQSVFNKYPSSNAQTIRRMNQCGFVSTDKTGRPVFYYNLGQVDFNEVLKLVKIEKFEMDLLLLCEHFFCQVDCIDEDQFLESATHHRQQLLLIIDLDGLSLFRNWNDKVFKMAMKLV